MDPYKHSKSHRQTSTVNLLCIELRLRGRGSGRVGSCQLPAAMRAQSTVPETDQFTVAVSQLHGTGRTSPPRRDGFRGISTQTGRLPTYSIPPPPAQYLWVGSLAYNKKSSASVGCHRPPFPREQREKDSNYGTGLRLQQLPQYTSNHGFGTTRLKRRLIALNEMIVTQTRSRCLTSHPHRRQ